MFIEGLNRLMGVYISAAKTIWRISVWGPFFILFLMQLLLLACLNNYVNPHLYPLLYPLVSLLGDSRVDIMAHYPGLYLVLPSVFQYGKLALGILFEGLITGITVIAFLKIFAGSKYSGLNIKSAIRQWHNLLLCWVVISAVLYALNSLIPPFFTEQMYGSPRRQMLFDLGMGLMTTIFYALFIYSLPIIIISGRNFIAAIIKSLSYFRKYPIFSFFIALIAYLITLPASFLSARSETIVDKFTPEMVFYVLAFGLVLDLLINILLTGALTKFLSDESN
ncbi:MAG: hypothetical protein ABIJ45_05735 [Candidatus Zixiibacteriota bacterium]